MCRTPLTGAEQLAAEQQSQRSVWDTNSVENELLFRLGSLQRCVVISLCLGAVYADCPTAPSNATAAEKHLASVHFRFPQSPCLDVLEGLRLYHRLKSSSFGHKL